MDNKSLQYALLGLLTKAELIQLLVRLLDDQQTISVSATLPRPVGR